MLFLGTSGRLRGTLASACLTLLVCLGLAGSHQSASGQGAQRVDLLLVLAIDASWSVNGAEYQLQVDGMAEAFQDEQILGAIEAGRLKRIAVTVVQWASETQQVVGVPWRTVENTAEAHALSAIIQAMPRMVSDGGTSIAAALKFSAKLILEAPYGYDRAVIDLATDGRNNNGGDPRPIRDLIGGSGITVNGLTILTEFPLLNKYFNENIATGPYSFVVTANSYAGYAKAIRKKLLKEIQGPPIS